MKQTQRRQALRKAVKAVSALTLVVDCSWPDAMVLELRAVKTADDLAAWTLRWPEHLSGRAAQFKRDQAMPARPVCRPPASVWRAVS